MEKLKLEDLRDLDARASAWREYWQTLMTGSPLLVGRQAAEVAARSQRAICAPRHPASAQRPGVGEQGSQWSAVHVP